MTPRLSRLGNGFRVASFHMGHVESASLGIWIGVGSRVESAEEHGLSHLIEHMAFKGTPTRTARSIAETIDGVGGEINAATGLESTAYFARVLKEHVPLALEILADIVQNPSFRAADLEVERDVVLQEIAAAADTPEDLVYDRAEQTAFPDQPLGRPILGTAERVAGFRPEHLRDFLERHYDPRLMVLSAAGAVDHDALVRHAEALFSGLAHKAGVVVSPARYRGGLSVEAKPFEQSHVVLGFPAPSYRHEDYYAAQMLSGLLGGGLSSRLFQEVRERRGLCYSIEAQVAGFADAGLFGIHSATAPEVVPELLDVVMGELAAIVEDGPSEAELQRARAQLKSGILMLLESSSARAEQMAHQILVHGRTLNVEELSGKVDAVTRDTVHGLARRMLHGPRPTLAVVGSTLDDRTYAGIVDRLGGSLAAIEAAS